MARGADMQPAPTPEARRLAKMLRQRRHDLGISQARATAKVGMLAKTASSLETDPGSCKLSSLLRYLSALELELVLQPKKSAEPER